MAAKHFVEVRDLYACKLDEVLDRVGHGVAHLL